MKIVCPQCGEVCETTEDVVIGQHIICPYCERKFSFDNSSNCLTGEEPSDAIRSICPFCGYIENVEPKYEGYICTCAKCGREFKIGDPKWRKEASKRTVEDMANRILKGILMVFLTVAVTLSSWFFIPKIGTFIKESSIKRAENQIRDKYLEMKQRYDHQLDYHGWTEVPGSCGWDKAGGFILTLSDGSMDWIILDYSPQTGNLVYPRRRIQPGLAKELIRTRIKIAEYEAKHKH